MLDDIKNKVQRILVDNFRVRLSKEGGWIVDHGSTFVLINVSSFGAKAGELGCVRLRAPLLRNVPLTPELLKWVALEGHAYKFGSVCAYESAANPSLGNLGFEYALIGVDIDESELKTAVVLVAGTGDDLDTKLHQKFGGEMVGEDRDK